MPAEKRREQFLSDLARDGRWTLDKYGRGITLWWKPRGRSWERVRVKGGEDMGGEGVALVPWEDALNIGRQMLGEKGK